MDKYLTCAQSKQNCIIKLVRKLAECESPSESPESINRFAELVREMISGVAKVRTVAAKGYGNHLRAEFILPGRKKSGQLLVLGHSDTVWPLGTLARMPVKEEDGRLYGPGVLDMKSGLAFFIFAMEVLRDLKAPVGKRVVLLLNSDEEIGSPSSRALTEAEARKSDAVLVLEPGTGLDGRLKTARKGVGDYLVRVHGMSAHAGLDFAAGANAIVELARQLERIAGFTRLERGLTVSPGVIRGGSRSNVVPAEASVEVDIRVAKLKDAGPLDRRFRTLKPLDKRCRIEVDGGLNRPPMERSKGGAALFRTARKLAKDLGVILEESTSGGGSDGNFTAALGVPTLDGLGGVGEGAHAAHESILTDRVADRTALIAKLVADL
jgi:glutamate carboxypeptidase